MENDFCIHTFKGERLLPESVQLSPDGKYVVSFASHDKTYIWELSSRNLIKTFNGLSWNAVSADGKYIAGEWTDKRTLKKNLNIFRFPDGPLISTINIEIRTHYCILSIDFSPSGDYIAIFVKDMDNDREHTEIWDLKSNKIVKKLEDYNFCIISHNWTYIIFMDNDNNFLIKDFWSEDLINKIKGDTEDLWAIRTSHDENYFIAGYGEDLDKLEENPQRNMYIKVWNIKTGELIWDLKGSRFGSISTIFSPDGNYIASGWAEGTLIVWDFQSGKQKLKWQGHDDHISSLSFSQDGNLLASSSYDETIKIWDFAGLIQEKQRIEILHTKQREKERQLKLNNRKIIKRMLLDYSTKFARIQVNELIEKTKINNKDLIIDVIVEMIRNNEIYAEYFSSSKAVVFNQQANIDEIDRLMATYKEWESKKENKK